MTAILPACACTHPPVQYSGLALPNTVDSATPNLQASKDVASSHRISAVLKDETTIHRKP